MCVITAGAGITAGMATMMNATLAVSAVGVGMSAYGMYAQQQSANAMAEYQADVAERNAKVAEYEGQYALEASREKALQHRKRLNAFLGEQRAAQGASGVEVDSGSFLDVTLDTVEQGKMDELAILHEGDLAVWRSEVQADSYNAQADLARMNQSSPFLAGGTALMTGAGSLGRTYASMKLS
jgi:hypothetical protein